MVSAASADGSPAGCPALLALAVPVNDVIGLLGANDAQCVDRCIRGCKVWVLARAPSKAAFWALTQLQELTHARHMAKGKNKHSISSKTLNSTRVQAFPRLRPAQREETPFPPSEYIQNTSVKDLILHPASISFVVKHLPVVKPGTEGRAETYSPSQNWSESHASSHSFLSIFSEFSTPGLWNQSLLLAFGVAPRFCILPKSW